MSKVEEFFRVEYIEIDDYVKPTVWFGVQGFDLIKQYADGDMSAQKHAEWYVSMFKKAIEAYHQSELKKINKCTCDKCTGRELESLYDDE